MQPEWARMCQCGCGQPVGRGKRFVRGHHWKTLTLEDRFWPRVRKTETCWLWTGGRTWNGYGVLFERLKTDRYRVHRLSYEWHVGSIPDGMDVCHTCDVRNCVNPAHLFLGSRAENLADMRNKGRAFAPPRKWGKAHHEAKIDEAMVRQIRQRVEAGQLQIDVARDLALSKSLVNRVVRRSTWSHVT